MNVRVPFFDNFIADIRATHTEAAGGACRIEFQQPTIAEDYDRRSNEAADLALRYGAAGYTATAEIAAALADAYAELAYVARWCEESRGLLRRAS